MLRIKLLTLFTVLSVLCSAQQPLNRDPQNIVDPTGFMRILTPPVKVEGSSMMFENWQSADVYLTNGKYGRTVGINYDIQNHLLPVMLNNKEYSLNPLSVDSLVLIDKGQTLVNTMLLKQLPGDAMILRLFDGAHVDLFKKSLIAELKPNYNELLNVGSRNIRLEKNEVHLITWGDSYYELSSKKKDLKALPHYEELSQYIKDENLSLKHEPDLIRLAQYLDQLN